MCCFTKKSADQRFSGDSMSQASEQQPVAADSKKMENEPSTSTTRNAGQKTEKCRPITQARNALTQRLLKEEKLKSKSPMPNDSALRKGKTDDTMFSLKSFKSAPRITKILSTVIPSLSKDPLPTDKTADSKKSREPLAKDGWKGVEEANDDDEASIPLTEDNFMYHDEDIIVTTHHILREKQYQPPEGDEPTEPVVTGNPLGELNILAVRPIFNHDTLHRNTYWANMLTMPELEAADQVAKEMKDKTPHKFDVTFKSDKGTDLITHKDFPVDNSEESNFKQSTKTAPKKKFKAPHGHGFIPECAALEDGTQSEKPSAKRNNKDHTLRVGSVKSKNRGAKASKDAITQDTKREKRDLSPELAASKELTSRKNRESEAHMRTAGTPRVDP